MVVVGLTVCPVLVHRAPPGARDHRDVSDDEEVQVDFDLATRRKELQQAGVDGDEDAAGFDVLGTDSLIARVVRGEGFFPKDSALGRLIRGETPTPTYTSLVRPIEYPKIEMPAYELDDETVEALQEAAEHRQEAERASIRSAEHLERLTKATLELVAHMQRLHDQQAAAAVDADRRWGFEKWMIAAGLLLALVAAATGVLQLL